MSVFLETIHALVTAGNYAVSLHANKELAKDSISLPDLLSGIQYAVVVEEYPIYAKGPCVLVLQQDRTGPVHALWGLRLNTSQPAVLVTAYRPDPQQWSTDFLRRRT